MKRILFSSTMIVAILAILLSSCKKDYLVTVPNDSVTDQDIFKSTDNAWKAINGMHRLLYIQYNSRQDQGGQSKNMIDMDMMGEDLVMPNTGNGWFRDTYRWLEHRNQTRWTPRFNFEFYYYIIANANMIIANIDGATGNEQDRKSIKGQAYAYRAWCYFQMIQLYGKRYDKNTSNDGLGLSLVLTPTTEELPRSTVAEVYTQIMSDVNNAITTLTGATPRINASYLNVNVAKGLKARVALAMQDWTTAAQFAKEARQGFSLMSNAQYMTGFNDYTNPEWIWGVRQIQDQQTYFYSFFAYMSCNFASTNIKGTPKCINQNLYNAIDANDIRKQLWDPTGANTSFPIPSGGSRFPYMNRKFTTYQNNAASIGDLPLMRVAEMYLIEAEALARAGQDEAARQALYPFAVNRNPTYVLSTNSGQALIDEIMIQRRSELWGEGFRFYDLKRLNLPLDRTNSNHLTTVASTMTVPAGDKAWEFLIPETELNTNRNCIQNPL